MLLTLTRFLEKKYTRVLKDIVLLLMAQGGAMVLTFTSHTYIARAVGPSQYGLFTLVVSIVAIGSLFSGVGFFSATGVLLAEEKSYQKQRELIGSIIIIALFIGIVFSFILVQFSGLINSFYKEDVGAILHLSWFALILVPCRELIMHIGKGLGSVAIITLLRTIIPALFLISIGGVFFLNGLSAQSLSLVYFSSVFTTMIFFFFKLRPRFIHLRNNYRRIAQKNREYGLKVYGSNIIANASQQAVSLIIPLYVSVSELAYYKVALMIIAPLSLISQNIALKFFRQFASQDKVNRKLYLINFLILCFGVLLVMICIDFLILQIYGIAYERSAGLVKIMIIGSLFNGLYQLPDAFMNSNSKGKSVLYSSFFMGISILFSVFLMVPRFGVTGAAYTYVVSNMVYFISIQAFYSYSMKQIEIPISK